MDARDGSVGFVWSRERLGGTMRGRSVAGLAWVSDLGLGAARAASASRLGFATAFKAFECVLS